MSVLKKKQLEEMHAKQQQAGGHVKNAVTAASGVGLFLASQMSMALPDIDLSELETWLESNVAVALLGLGMIILGIYALPSVLGYVKRVF